MKLREHIVPVVGFVLILISAFVYNRIEDTASFGDLGIVVILAVMLYSLLLTIYTWFYTKPYSLFEAQREAYDTVHAKISSTVDKLVQRQRFIDQSILSVIEGQAQNIWVITTKLANELNDTDLERAVENNLRQGKHYTYFLPHPDSQFLSAKRNLELFKNLPLYREYRSQIELIHLPPDTQFLLEEVVIYNPEQQENRDDETKGINGFTYYEAKDEDSDTLHMRIEGDLLRFLADQLFVYLRASGLRFAVERVLTEFQEILGDHEKLYLVQLLGARDIKDSQRYEEFISGLKDSEDSMTDCAKVIDRMLSPYTVRA